MSDTLFILNTLLVVLTLIHMLYQKRPAPSLIAWMLALILIPFGGVLLYLIFGSRKILYRTPKPTIHFDHLPSSHPQLNTSALSENLAKLIEGNHLAAPSQNNRLSVLPDAHLAYQAMLDAIDQAQHSLYFETYIFELDAIGTQLLEKLAHKAQQGIKVRLLIDAFGAIPLYLQPWKLAPYRQAGVQIAFFHPFEALLKNRINLRTHRKIYLIDEHTLFTGGINLSEDYLSNSTQHQSWIDLCFKIEGEDCQPYLTVFQADWHYTTGEHLPLSNYTPPLLSTENSFYPILLQAVPSGPDIATDALLESLLQAILNAEKEILLVTPYLIPSHNILDALYIALKKGVEVTLLTPAKTDHLIFDWGRSSYMRELHEMGANIYCYDKNMVHAKLFIFDREVTVLGSANLDYRSLLVNYEMVSFAYDTALAQQMKQWADNLIQQSKPYHPNPNSTIQLLENLFRIITPLL